MKRIVISILLVIAALNLITLATTYYSEGNWRTNLIQLGIQDGFLVIVLFFLFRRFTYVPIQRLIGEMTKLRKNLKAANTAAREEARFNLERFDSPWTANRLKEFIQDSLKDRTFIVVSNREPYIHTKDGGKVKWFVPASGMATAIEPMLGACGGTWIAQGSGNADRQTVNENDELQVPPDDPKYTLHRVWLTPEEEKGFYYGFSNDGMWPLCHVAHTRPNFRKEDWEQYKNVNQKFADVVLNKIKKCQRPIIFIQDFHFALLPKMIKSKRPDATIGLFWHIPWVSSESFSICPWKKEILDGMLGADLLGFHTQLHCNNFIDTVAHELESRIDHSSDTITRHDHTSLIKAFPISIAFTNGQDREMMTAADRTEMKEFLCNAGIKTDLIGFGVDRLDYTKGILERFKAVEIFLTKYPEYTGKFTFVQIAAPTRTEVDNYRDFAADVTSEAKRINEHFKKDDWQPIVLIAKHHNHEQINRYFKAANFCLVTSLHDGMNLVAKEFIAARGDQHGVLILSQFTGAARELTDALIINPYNGEQTADAIQTALTMSGDEQTRRMENLRKTVRNNNIYRWSAQYLKSMMDVN